MRYLILLIIAVYSYAGLLDFDYLNKAKTAYSKGDYTNASQNYAKVNNDEARYDLANSLYKQKKYKEALGVYSKISNKNLEFNKLHNIGNTLAQLGKTDEAIKAYEDALKIKKDKDTKFNLDLLKKQKKQQKKQDKKNKDQNKKQNQKKKQKKDNKQGKKSQENKKKQSQKNQQDQKKKQNKKSDKQSQEKKSKKAKNKQKQEKAKKEKAQQKKEKRKEKQAQKQKQKMDNKNPQKKQPISNMEERKWQKMLNQKGINTLMLPIRKGEKQNEKTPW